MFRENEQLSIVTIFETHEKQITMTLHPFNVKHPDLSDRLCHLPKLLYSNMILNHTYLSLEKFSELLAVTKDRMCC